MVPALCTDVTQAYEGREWIEHDSPFSGKRTCLAPRKPMRNWISPSGFLLCVTDIAQAAPATVQHVDTGYGQISRASARVQ